MAGPTVTTPYTPPSVVDLAQETLDRAAEVVAVDDSWRVFVSHGEPPAPLEACDQLTVHLVQLRAKLLRDSQQVATQSKLVAWVASLAVVRFGCVPVLDEEGHDFDQIATDTAHKALLADATSIARHLSRLWATKAYPETVPTCGDVTWGPVQPLPPQGGQAAYRQVVDIQL